MSVYSGRAAGAYGAKGGIIEFIWEPRPEEVASKLIGLAGYLENFVPPLTASKGVARADMAHHFDSESGPNGEAWAPLAESTIERWGEHSILQLTGDMRGAATSDAAYPIDGHELFFDTGALPYYWIFAEDGTQASHMREFVKQVGIENLAPGAEYSGGGSPPRPFIGVSEEAEIQIIEIFDMWFEGGVSAFYTQPTTGTVQPITSSGFGPGIRGGIPS